MSIANINDVDLYYRTTGRGRAVVFVHGYTGSSNDWISQIEAMASNYTVVAFDLRGHGKSDAPTREQDYSVEIFVEDVHGILDHLNIKNCCLVGHSLGGFIALEFALKYSHMLAALVLVDTSSGDWEKPSNYAEWRVKLEKVARTRGMEAAFEYDAVHNPTRLERFRRHPELKEISRQKMLMTSVDGYVYAARAMGNWEPVTERLPEITVPTCVIWGDEDSPFREASHTLGEMIPNAELLTVKGSGHSPHEEAPNFFNDELLKFLGKIGY